MSLKEISSTQYILLLGGTATLIGKVYVLSYLVGKIFASFYILYSTLKGWRSVKVEHWEYTSAGYG